MSDKNGYFSFSKRERTGVIALVILIFIVFLVPRFVPEVKNEVDLKSFEEISKQLQALKPDTAYSDEAITRNKFNDEYKDGYPPSEKFKKNKLLFQFDPNTLSEEGWRKLGVSNRTITTIRNYISKGGRFRTSEDIGRIYGLRKDQYVELLPFVRIDDPPTVPYERKQSFVQPKSVNKEPRGAFEVIDINTADTSMLIALPGIGSKLANRIISFRNKLGGFYSVDQLKETYGLPDSTFKKIEGFMECTSSGIQQMDINTVDVATLKSHPYVKWNIANAIVNYRKQHGNYESINDLLKIEIISSELLEKLRPYLAVMKHD